MLDQPFHPDASGGAWALIVAAGSGSRCAAGEPKQFAPLGDRPVLSHSLAAFAACPEIAGCLVVIDPDWQPVLARAAAAVGLPEPAWTAGGSNRQESVRHGLAALADKAPAKVLIHDAARPAVTPATIRAVIARLTEADAAIAACPVADTLKRAHDVNGAPMAAATVPRDGLWQAQTPQGFTFSAICKAHDRAASDSNATDDAQIAEAAGYTVALVAAPARNFKITTAEDLATMRALFDAQRLTVAGSGYDIHRVEPGAGVTLAGVLIPADVRLSGQSDADVVLHALTDAILGTVGEADIGYHFPPSDPRWRDAASDTFLNFALERLAARGGRLLHLDTTVICQRPALTPHRPAMTARLAELTGLAPSHVSLKATTHEELGALGRGQGIACHATVTVSLPDPGAAPAAEGAVSS